MKIALFTETYLPHINGIVTHVKILKEGLEKLGHEVLVVTADASTSRHYIQDGILHCPAINSKKFYGYSLAKPISRKRLRFVKEFSPDVIHIHNEFGIGFSGMMCAKILKTPLVYTLHTMYDDYIYYIAPKALINTTTRIAHRYMKIFATKATEITGPSPKCQEYFNESGIDRNVNVIPNAVEMEEFTVGDVTSVEKMLLRKKYNIPENNLVACFVGRLGKEKSVEVLLDFWAEEIDPKEGISLIVIGDGPVKIELEAQAKELGITNMVTFAGKIMHNELAPYYAMSDVYVTASLSDTNSISMLEGMCAGLPVLQRTDPLNVGQVVDGNNGYNFDDAKEFGQNLRRIKNMDEEELIGFKKSVTDSIKDSGAITLATNTMLVYKKAVNHTDNVSHKILNKFRNNH